MVSQHFGSRDALIGIGDGVAPYRFAEWVMFTGGLSTPGMCGMSIGTVAGPSCARDVEHHSAPRLTVCAPAAWEHCHHAE
jgi:hypothetical protein